MEDPAIYRKTDKGKQEVAGRNACSTALELRAKLRKLEDTLTKLLGPADGAELARRIGGELTRLVPKRD